MVGHELADIEEVWHGFRRPMPTVCLAVGEGERPDVSAMPTFRPLMFSHQIEDGELAGSIRKNSSPNGNGTASACKL